MNLKKALITIATLVADEAARNEAFRERLHDALELLNSDSHPSVVPNVPSARRGGRREPARLDPIELAQNGESALRDKLEKLSMSQLLDVVAEYGMDPGKLVMKWKEPKRVIDRIVELSLSRSTKGDAFREQ